jgi:SdpC family antimicrobial peptide
MKRKKWTSLLYFRGLPLLLSILLLDGGSGISFSASARAVRSVGYDGETIFRGVFFASGPVAELVPEIWDIPHVREALRNQSEARAQAAADRQNRMVAWIKGQDSLFFDRFGLDLQSGDHLRVEQALEEAGGRIREALAADLGATPEEILRAPELFEADDVIIDVAVAVEVVAAAVLVVVFVLVLAQEPGRFSSLLREMLIDAIATRLGPEAAR